MTTFKHVLAGVCALALVQASQAASNDQKANEAALDAGISAQDQLDWMKQMASAPNHVH